MGLYCESSHTTTACAVSTVTGLLAGAPLDPTSSTACPSTRRAAVSFSTQTDTLYLSRDLNGPLYWRLSSANASGVPFLQLEGMQFRDEWCGCTDVL
jgi:hypothetical protein